MKYLFENNLEEGSIYSYLGRSCSYRVQQKWFLQWSFREYTFQKQFRIQKLCWHQGAKQCTASNFMLLEPGIAGLSCQDVRYRGPNLSTLWFCGETIIKCVWLLAFMPSSWKKWSIRRSRHIHGGILWFTEKELRDAPDAEAGAEAGTPEPPAGHSWHAHGGSASVL